MSMFPTAAHAIVLASVVGGVSAALPFDPGRIPIWHVPGAARGTPTHDADTVYFLSSDRAVVAIDAAAGTVRWKTDTGVASRDGIFGATTAGTTLVVAGPMVVAGDWDVVGFERATGRRRWTYTAPAGDGPGLFLGQADGDVVFAGSPGGRVYALDATTGRPKWITPIQEGHTTSVFPPVAHGALVVIGYSTYVSPNLGGLAALDAATGRIRWRTEFPRPPERWRHTNLAGGPIVVDDVVFGSAGDGNIYAFDLDTGDVRWAFPRLRAPLAGGVTTPDVDHRAITRSGRLLVAGSTTGAVVAYDIDSRTERWRFSDGASGSTMFGFAADSRLVYVPFFGGFIVALDAVTGVERWRTGDYMQGFIWPPDVHGDRIYAGAAYTGFHALPTTPREDTP